MQDTKKKQKLQLRNKMINKKKKQLDTLNKKKKI